tara:strand:+ start:909 stop:1085 length:177 start_codon:yes stop_codon:yes gene_type:complete
MKPQYVVGSAEKAHWEHKGLASDTYIVLLLLCYWTRCQLAVDLLCFRDGGKTGWGHLQ